MEFRFNVFVVKKPFNILVMLRFFNSLVQVLKLCPSESNFAYKNIESLQIIKTSKIIYTVIKVVLQIKHLNKFPEPKSNKRQMICSEKGIKAILFYRLDAKF